MQVRGFEYGVSGMRFLVFGFAIQGFSYVVSGLGILGIGVLEVRIFEERGFGLGVSMFVVFEVWRFR